MKKIFVGIMFLMCCTINIQADVGNNVRYSRPSYRVPSKSSSSNKDFEFNFDWLFDSSDSDSYKPNHSNREKYTTASSSTLEWRALSSLEIKLYIIVALVILLIRYYPVVMMVLKFFKKKSETVEYYEEEPVKKLPKVIHHQHIEQKILKKDALFSAKQMFAYSKEVFVALQTAWTNKDWEKVRQFETDRLYAMHKNQLEEYIRNKTTNVVEKINILAVGLHKFETDENFEYLTVDMSVTLRDYIISDKTKKVLEGYPNEDIEMVYELVFVRELHSKSTKILNVTQCSGCGAKESFDEKGVCGFCNSLKIQQWQLNSIQSKYEEE